MVVEILDQTVVMGTDMVMALVMVVMEMVVMVEMVVATVAVAMEEVEENEILLRLL